LRLGAFLVPLAVSAVPVGVLVWYGLVHIPSQERYLNERNLRLLMTVSGNIAAAVDNFDNAIDHGVASFWRKGRNEAKQQENLAAGVRKFAPELEILTATTESPKQTAAGGSDEELLKNANDPPYIRLSRDEGHWSLDVAARIAVDKDTVLRVLAKADIENVVQPPLRATQADFDAVLLVAQNGDVIARRSPIGIALSNIQNVLRQRGDRRALDRNAPETSFDTVRDFSNVMPLSIGDAEYKIYLQPVPLSLVDKDGKSEGWVICGLVRADRFRAEVSALSYPTLLWFTAALAVVLLAIPFVKLHVLRPRERLHANDAGWVTAAMFVSVGLLAIAALDVVVFDFRFRHVVDDRLARVSKEIDAHVSAEVARILEQSRNITDANVKSVSEQLGGDGLPTIDPSGKSLEPGQPLVCDPRPSCGLISFKTDGTSYPFIYQASWFGRDGRQLIKQMPGLSITPFINMRTERIEYLPEIDRAWMSPDESRGIAVLKSPNTGRPITVLWRLPAKTERVATQSIALYTLVSLGHPMLPKGVSFAVVNQAGRTIFHSEASRSLQEDFLKECEDNELLRAAIKGASTSALTASYLGHPSRLVVTPLAFQQLTNDPRWSLIVFQDGDVADTVNLETVTLACILFFAYGGALAIAALLMRTFGRRGWTKWFWPVDDKQRAHERAYVGIARMNAAAAVVVVAGAWLPPVAWLTLTIAVAIGALTLTRRMVVESGPGDAPRGFGVLHPYFVARAASLLVLAALPAIACYHVAYTFETSLLATSEATYHEHDEEGRKDRIARFVSRFRLLDAANKPFSEDLRRRDYDQIDALLWPDATKSGRCAPCDRLLAWIHPPYNDVAIDLKAAVGEEAVPGAGEAVRLWMLALVVAGLFVVCFAFVYLFLRPLFALRAVASAGLVAPLMRTSARRLLTIGPPGSGKSTQLGAIPGIRVFDVARQAYVERRHKQVGHSPERRKPVVAAAAAGAGRWQPWSPFDPDDTAPPPRPTTTWADAFDIASPNDPLGIDHLDYRLDDREFAAQTLRVLERAIEADVPIHVVCDRDPLTWLAEYRAPAAEVVRWARALTSFEQQIVSVGYTEATEKTAIDRRILSSLTLERADELADKRARERAEERAREEHLAATMPHYEALWRACAPDEQLALCQLAEEGMVNPQSHAVVRRLMRVGLIVRDPVPRLMVDSFRQFVVQTPGADDLSAREHVGVSVPWGSVKAALMTVVAGLAGLLIVTQQQLVSAWIGFVPALMPAVQRAWTLFSSIRPSPKGEGTA
jgi:hypothetical protein